MDVTTPYEFIGFGAMDVTKSCEFMGFGAMDVTKPYEFIRFVPSCNTLMMARTWGVYKWGYKFTSGVIRALSEVIRVLSRL